MFTSLNDIFCVAILVTSTINSINASATASAEELIRDPRAAFKVNKLAKYSSTPTLEIKNILSLCKDFNFVKACRSKPEDKRSTCPKEIYEKQKEDLLSHTAAAIGQLEKERAALDVVLDKLKEFDSQNKLTNRASVAMKSEIADWNALSDALDHMKFLSSLIIQLRGE